MDDLCRDSLETCSASWGENSFRRYTAGAFRDQFLASMYDAQMIAVDSLPQATIIKLKSKKSAILTATKKLFTDKRFEEAVRASTNTPSRVRYRIEAIVNLLKSI